MQVLQILEMQSGGLSRGLAWGLLGSALEQAQTRLAGLRHRTSSS